MSSARTLFSYWRPGLLIAGVAAAVLGVGTVLLGPAGAVRTSQRPAQRGAAYVAEAPDPLAAASYPLPASALHHAKARAPRVAVREAFLSPGAPSDQQILAQLHEEQQVQKSELKASPKATVNAVTGMASGQAGLPLPVQEVIAGGNAIADFPYVYGGGHRSFVDDAYDCSGSVSYALAAGRLISAPETSGQLESWGVPGPGRYITVFAAVGHTFMYVDGLWFDTAGRAGPYSTRWLTKQPSLAGYVERHYPGL
ncbi:MAG: hypothetical protein ABSG64_03040 [Solirubrobacteraceae bacterium]|jgi:hypothetical protein